MAVTSRLIRESDGREKLAVSLGQIQYFDDSRVGLRASSPVVESGRPAWVADATYAITDRWTIGPSYLWDTKSGRADLACLRHRYLIDRQSVVQGKSATVRVYIGGAGIIKQKKQLLIQT